MKGHWQDYQEDLPLELLLVLKKKKCSETAESRLFANYTNLKWIDFNKFENDLEL